MDCESVLSDTNIACCIFREKCDCSIEYSWFDIFVSIGIGFFVAWVLFKLFYSEVILYESKKLYKQYAENQIYPHNLNYTLGTGSQT